MAVLLCRYATQAAKEEQERRRAQYQEQIKRQQEAEAQRQQQQQGATPSQQQQQQQTQQQQQQTPSTPLASGNSTPDMGGSGNQLQIIGMSATLPNMDQVAAWLDAVLYQTDFRPVQLRQYIKLGKLLKDQEGQVRGCI
jgi:TolA-binding protein